MRKSKNKAQLRSQAIEQIKELFIQAKENSKMANEYVKIARKIAMKLNIKIPKEYKRKYCKHCYTYFTNGNYKARTRNGYMIYHCFNCKKMMKFKITKTT